MSKQEQKDYTGTITEKAVGASKRQGWAIYTHLGYDIRPAELTRDQASKVIELSMAGRKKDAIHLLNTLGAEKKKDIREKASSKAPGYQDLFNRAMKAGQAAAEKCIPTPMVVVEHENQAAGLLGPNPTPVKKTWKVNGGVCGFAWVHFPDARKSFVKWLKKENLGRKDSYRGGWFLSSMYKPPRDEGQLIQSMAINQAWTGAFCDVLLEEGIKCRPMSRID